VRDLAVRQHAQRIFRTRINQHYSRDVRRICLGEEPDKPTTVGMPDEHEGRLLTRPVEQRV
jgi:hypothetical protein